MKETVGEAWPEASCDSKSKEQNTIEYKNVKSKHDLLPDIRVPRSASDLHRHFVTPMVRDVSHVPGGVQNNPSDFDVSSYSLILNQIFKCN